MEQDAAAVQTVGAPLSTIVASQSQIDPRSATRNTTKRYKCLVSGCKARASYGTIGELPSYCEEHKQSGSVNLITPTNRVRGKGKDKPATVQSKLVSFLTPGSVKASRPSSQTQLIQSTAPDNFPPQSSELGQVEMHGETTESDETEVESPARILSGNKSETPNTSKVHGLKFDSDSDTELLAIPQHPIISERKQVQLALQMSLKE